MSEARPPARADRDPFTPEGPRNAYRGASEIRSAARDQRTPIEGRARSVPPRGPRECLLRDERPTVEESLGLYADRGPVGYADREYIQGFLSAHRAPIQPPCERLKIDLSVYGGPDEVSYFQICVPSICARKALAFLNRRSLRPPASGPFRLLPKKGPRLALLLASP